MVDLGLRALNSALPCVKPQLSEGASLYPNYGRESAKSTPSLSYPIAPFLNGPGILSANADYRDRKDMYASQWGLSVQQALPHDLLGTVSYVGRKGTYRAQLITWNFSCAVRRHGLPSGANSARQLSFQPVAIRVVAKLTNRLKPQIKRVLKVTKKMCPIRRLNRWLNF